MKVYWPYADTNYGEHLYTYDSCSTIKDALKCIKNWNKNYWIKKAWIEIHEIDVGYLAPGGIIKVDLNNNN